MTLETLSLLEIIQHILNKHPTLAPTIEDLAQNVIYARGERDKNRYFSLNELDKKLEKYLNFNNGFFVELGANDGVTQSNTLFFERTRGWRGILIEPTPHNYLLCLKNRAPENKVFCNACVSAEFSDPFVEILYSNLMSVATGLESDIQNSRAHADLGAQFLKAGERVFSFGAKASTLTQILRQSTAPPLMDLLSLDVEGAEIEVLRGLDHDSFKFRYLLVETRDFKRMESYLTEVGYVFLEPLSDHDYLFKTS